jgi:hypothetical protein
MEQENGDNNAFHLADPLAIQRSLMVARGLSILALGAVS